jgi:PAS domain S-box-containing protein
MRMVENGKPGTRVSGKIRPERADNGGLRIDLGTNFALGRLADKNVIGIAVIKSNGDVVSINDHYLTDILGYSREDFDAGGLNLLTIAADDPATLEKFKEEFRRTGRVRTTERARYRKDGSIVWTLVGYAGIDGHSDLVASWAHDITDQKRAEMTNQYLLEANKIMASSVELQPLLEKIAAVTLVNGFSDFCTIHLPDDGERLVCRALIHKDPELTRQVKRIIDRYPRYLSDAIGPARVIRTGRSEMSTRHTPLDRENFKNEQHFHSIRALALKSYMSVPLFLNGKTIGALTLTSMSRQFDPEDLKTAEALALRASQHIENAKLHEELKRSSRELQRSNRDLTYYASIAAHDLKSPLATSQSYLNLLLEEAGSAMDPQHRAWLMRAIGSNQKLLSQVDRLLTFSNSPSNEIIPQNVPVETVVRTAIENLQNEIEVSGAELTYGYLPTVKGDPTLLTLLFQNLLSNSIRYRGEAPLIIKIEVIPGSAQWVFQVTDNGIGFDSECAEKIFRMFEQLPERESDEGQGIGLATCRKIIEAHRGKIWAEATPGFGAKFSFTLPV